MATNNTCDVQPVQPLEEQFAGLAVANLHTAPPLARLCGELIRDRVSRLEVHRLPLPPALNDLLMSIGPFPRMMLITSVYLPDYLYDVIPDPDTGGVLVATDSSGVLIYDLHGNNLGEVTGQEGCVESIVIGGQSEIYTVENGGVYMYRGGQRSEVLPGQFTGPRGLCMKSSHLHVLAFPPRLHKVDTSGQQPTLLSTITLDDNISCPCGLCILHDDTFMISDYNRHCVYHLDSQGACIQTLGSPGLKGDTHRLFSHPSGVGEDPSHNILICDRGNRRIAVYSPTGALRGHLQLGEECIREPLALCCVQDLLCIVTRSPDRLYMYRYSC